MELINGDCLDVMKDLSDNSIDFLFADLPYGQTSCKWDSLIDLNLFWEQVNRVCKQDAVMAFTCSVKFGNTLINSNPKCFRYDLIWVKSAACGFLNAKKMPMKKHEMIYIFYRKLAKVYTENIALHHTHKFLKATENKRKKGGKGCYTNGSKTETVNKYDPPLPTSVIKEEKAVINSVTNNSNKHSEIYNEIEGNIYTSQERKTNVYDPPLPNSVIKEEEDVIKTNLYSSKTAEKPRELYRNEGGQYAPPLPNSVIKEETFIRGKNKSSTNKDVYNSDERFNNGKLYHHNRKLQKGDDPIYDPPLPNSVIKEENVVVEKRDIKGLYGEEKDKIRFKVNGKLRDSEPCYDPPLPNSILEIKSEKGKHATQKPVPLMEYLIKYFTREGETVLDPTMGSGGTGIACKNLNRKFIGIEMDKDIFDVAVERNKWS